MKDQTLFKDGGIWYKCNLCTNEAKSGSIQLQNWEMNHLHFGDEDVELLLCPSCKGKSPSELLKIISKDKMQ